MLPLRLTVTSIASVLVLLALGGCATEAEEAEESGAAIITGDERIARLIVEDFPSKGPDDSPIQSWDLVVVENTKSERYVVAMAFDGVGRHRKEVVEIVMLNTGESVKVDFRAPDGGMPFADRTAEKRQELISSLKPDVEALQKAVQSLATRCNVGKFVEASFYGLITAISSAVAFGGCASIVVSGPAGTVGCLGGAGVAVYAGSLAWGALKRECSSDLGAVKTEQPTKG